MCFEEFIIIIYFFLLVCTCLVLQENVSVDLLSVHVQVHPKQEWLFFFFFLNTCNHTMINCEDLHISNLKNNTVFRPKISQAKRS